MTTASRRRPLPPTCAALLRAAAALVPHPRREAWEREWRGELTWAWHTGARGAFRLTLRAFWVWTDALWIRTEELSMNKLSHDLRVAVRGFRQRPGFAAVALLTLALAIGANTAVFSVVDGVLLRPLDYPEPDRLVSVNLSALGLGYPFVPLSDGFYVMIRDRQRTLDALGMFQEEVLNVVGDATPVQVASARVTPPVFDVLRVPPALGRTFVAEDAVPGAEPVVVLSDELWRTRYGADAGILDTSLEMDGVSRRVVGVMPPGFAFPNGEVRTWTPFVIDEAAPNPGAFSSPGIGRLAPGATLESLHDDIASILLMAGEVFPTELPQAVLDQAGFAPQVEPAKERMVGDLRLPLLVVLGTVGLVLLIACANLANLFLVRAEIRQREVTLRAALGAGRGDLARLFLSESLVLSIVGGTLGIVLAAVGVRAFVAAAPVAIPRLENVGLDARVLAFCAAVSVLTGLLFGAVPALRVRASELATALREGGRSATSGRGTLMTRDVLVVAQVSLALLLLIGSGLMLRSFQRLRDVAPGIDAAGVATMRVDLPAASYPGLGERNTFWRTLIERAAAIPGVTAAGAIDQLPLGTRRSNGSLEIEDHPRADDALPPLAEQKRIFPGTLEAMGVPLVAGRFLGPDDRADGFRAVVVSSSFAQRWWPEGSALGRRLRADAGDDWYEIVGVVGDVHFASLEEPAEETVYYPAVNGPAAQPRQPAGLALVVRGGGDTDALLERLREEVWELDPRQPITFARPLQGLLDSALARTSFTMTLLGIAASMAVLIGAIGIYGVISYLVSQRIPEIGVRLALGASAREVRRMVLRRGLVLTGLGIAAGLAAAIALTRTLGGLLYEVEATDPVTYAAVVAVVGTVAVLAAWLPAVRASNVDPVVALRGE